MGGWADPFTSCSYLCFVQCGSNLVRVPCTHLGGLPVLSGEDWRKREARQKAAGVPGTRGWHCRGVGFHKTNRKRLISKQGTHACQDCMHCPPGLIITAIITLCHSTTAIDHGALANDWQLLPPHP